MNARRAHILDALAECADGAGHKYRGELFAAMRLLAQCTCGRVCGSDDAVEAPSDPDHPVAPMEGADQ